MTIRSYKLRINEIVSVSFVRLIGILSVTGVYYSTLFLLNNMGSSSSDSKDDTEWYKCVGGSIAITAGVFCCVFFIVLGRSQSIIDSIDAPSYGGYPYYDELSMGMSENPTMTTD